MNTTSSLGLFYPVNKNEYQDKLYLYPNDLKQYVNPEAPTLESIPDVKQISCGINETQLISDSKCACPDSTVNKKATIIQGQTFYVCKK